MILLLIFILAAPLRASTVSTDAAQNRRLLTHDLSWWVEEEHHANELKPIFETVSELLNDPEGVGITFVEARDTSLAQEDPYPDVLVHGLVFAPRDAQAWNWSDQVTFLRTDNGPVNDVDEYVKGDWIYTYADWFAQSTPPEEDTPYQMTAHTPVGDEFEKDCTYNGTQSIPYHHYVKVPFEAGEMGPAMLILSGGTQGGGDYTQTIQLHKGWNLVSWEIVPIDNYGQFINMNEILPTISPLNDWFFDHGGKLYRHEHAEYEYNYPDWNGSEDWVWDLNNAYYIKLDNVSVEDGSTWGFADQPQYHGEGFDIHPYAAWDDSLDEYYPDQASNGWFFIAYAAPGYCKLATIYDQWPPPSGHQDYNSFVGPFHWLYWYHDDLQFGYAHRRTQDQYLVMVKTDDGKIYLPYDPNNPYYPHVDNGQEYDEIGMLQPGRGYFLGFRRPTDQIHFDGWGAYPGWPQQGLPSQPATPPQTYSAAHFQYKAFTHWCYPVFIDTVDLEATPMVSGDEIGIFDGEQCVGASVYSGHFPLKITCWKDDLATPDSLDGYLAGDEMTFVWFDASENQEVTFVPPPGTQSLADDPVAPSHSGFGAGMYGVRSLAYGVQSVQQLPQEFKMGQNFPNPFNAETAIPIELPQRSRVILEIFNVKGQKLGLPFEHTYDAGWPKIRWNAAKLPSGIYFYRITAEGLERSGKFVDAGKMLVLK